MINETASEDGCRLRVNRPQTFDKKANTSKTFAKRIRETLSIYFFIIYSLFSFIYLSLFLKLCQDSSKNYEIFLVSRLNVPPAQV